MPEQRLLGGQDVVRSARGLDHALRSSVQERVRLLLGAQRGFGAVARIDDGFRWEALEEHADRLQQGFPVGERQIRAADRPGEEQVSGKQAAVGVIRDVAGRVAGDGDDLERDAGDVDGVAAVDALRSFVGPERNVGKELAGLLEHRPLELWHVDRCPRPLGEVRDAHQVIPVAVRDQDAGAARAHACRLQPELCCPVTGVDHGRLRGSTVHADGVAVLLRGSEHVTIDDEGHR